MAERLKKKQVRAIKKAIVAGEAVASVAEQYGVPYMTIYKIAAGSTWVGVKPRGRLIGTRVYAVRRSMSLDKCELIALKKMQKKLSNIRIAKKLRVSESTVQRANALGRGVVLTKINQATLAGERRKTLREMGLTEADAEELEEVETPDWVRREVGKNG